MITSTLRRVGLAAILFLGLCCARAGAQSYDLGQSQFADAQGDANHTDRLKTGEGPNAMPVSHGANAVISPVYTAVSNVIQSSNRNLSASLGGYQNTLAPKFGQTGLNGLPVCNMDSFVYQAMQTGQAEMIYGDEGTDSLPPLDDFQYINSGIGADSSGLTTGHGSMMPSAWGADGEWSMSGAN